MLHFQGSMRKEFERYLRAHDAFLTPQECIQYKEGTAPHFRKQARKYRKLASKARAEYCASHGSSYNLSRADLIAWQITRGSQRRADWVDTWRFYSRNGDPVGGRWTSTLFVRHERNVPWAQNVKEMLSYQERRQAEQRLFYVEIALHEPHGNDPLE